MKGIIAACIAVGVLWVVDVGLNDGRYGEVVKKAATSILSRRMFSSRGAAYGEQHRCWLPRKTTGIQFVSSELGIVLASS